MTTEQEAKAEVAADVGVIDATADLDNALSQFRLLPENAIPIPPTIGERFSEYFEDGVRMMKEHHKGWEANIKEFQNVNAGDSLVPFENLVRTTIESLVDYTYMRNPSGEISSHQKEDHDLVKTLTKALDALINKRTLPGINLRPKVLKQIIYAHLTNFGILELTYQEEKGSLEQVLEVNEKIKQAIKAETDPAKAEKYYELLDILQRELDVRKHAGIGVRSRSPFSLIIDPLCQELDLSDCRWVMDRDVMRIDYIIAEYTNAEEGSDRRFFKYDSNVELDLSSSPPHTKEQTETQIINDLMPDIDGEQAKLRTKNTVGVVWVYDKTTRLKYLYIEGRWETPLWVYADEMELSTFFPFFIMAFSTPLASIIQTGEVSHYMGFQREINRINAQVSKVRRRAFTKFVYDSSSIDKTEVEKFFQLMENENNTIEAIGLRLKGSDKALSEILEPLKMPTTQFKEVFDKSDLKEGMDKTTRVSDAIRGAEFRTNTTNDAINTYNQAATNRLEGLTDKIEIAVERLLWGMVELIVSKMTAAQINQMLPTKDAAEFKSLTVEELNQNHNLIIAAGSTEKPTSQAKKQEATQIIQMLGQFGTAAPMTVLSLVTRLLRSAFSKSLVTEEDLKKLEQEGQAAMQKGISTQQGNAQPPQT